MDNLNLSNKEIGNRIRILREKSELTQQQLAEKLHITRSQIGHIEIGSRLPSVPLLIDLSQFFNVSTDYLLGLSKEKRIKTPMDKQLSSLTDEEYHDVLRYIDMIKCFRSSKKNAHINP